MHAYMHTDMPTHTQMAEALNQDLEQSFISHSASKSLHDIGRKGSDLLSLKLVSLKVTEGRRSWVSGVYLVLFPNSGGLILADFTFKG